MKKFIRLILFSAMLLLLTVGCGISSEDVDATVEARIASMPTPNIDATVQAVIALTPTPTPKVVITEIIVTATPSVNLTGGEAEGLVRTRIQTKLMRWQRGNVWGSWHSCSYVAYAKGFWARRYIPEDKVWEITFTSGEVIGFGETSLNNEPSYRLITPVGYLFTWLVYDRTEKVVPKFSYC